MHQEQWIEAFTTHGLKDVWDQVAPYARNSIVFDAIPTHDQNLPLGASKIGGLPHLPSNIDWSSLKWKVEWDPEDDEEILGTQNGLGFVAQLNLAQIHLLDTEDLLPTHGMLYFFYDIQQQPPYRGQQEDGFFRAFYSSDEANQLAVQQQPALVRSTLPAHALEFRKHVTLPSCDSPEIVRLGLAPEQLNAYQKVRHFEFPLANQVLGYPDPVHLGYRLDSDFYEAYGRPVNQEMTEWLCLLQLCSSESLPWGPTGNGEIYFAVMEADLKQQNFTQVAFTMQLT